MGNGTFNLPIALFDIFKKKKNKERLTNLLVDNYLGVDVIDARKQDGLVNDPKEIQRVEWIKLQDLHLYDCNHSLSMTRQNWRTYIWKNKNGFSKDIIWKKCFEPSLKKSIEQSRENIPSFVQ